MPAKHLPGVYIYFGYQHQNEYIMVTLYEKSPFWQKAQTWLWYHRMYR